MLPSTWESLLLICYCCWEELLSAAVWASAIEGKSDEKMGAEFSFWCEGAAALEEGAAILVVVDTWCRLKRKSLLVALSSANSV